MGWAPGRTCYSGSTVPNIAQSDMAWRQKPSRLVAKVLAEARAGESEAAEAALEELMSSPDEAPTLICYGAVATACAKAGRLAAAERWLETLVASGLGAPNVICLNTLVSASAKYADAERAEAWVARMPSLGIQPDAMTFNALSCSDGPPIDHEYGGAQ